MNSGLCAYKPQAERYIHSASFGSPPSSSFRQIHEGYPFADVVFFQMRPGLGEHLQFLCGREGLPLAPLDPRISDAPHP